MDDIEGRIIVLEQQVKAMHEGRRRHDEEWQRFLEKDDKLHQEVQLIRRRVNGWYYTALIIAFGGGGVISRFLPF